MMINKLILGMMSLVLVIMTGLDQLPPAVAIPSPILLARRNRNRAIPPVGEAHADWGTIRIPDGLSFDDVNCTDSVSCKPIFTNFLAFQVLVRDPQAGNRNGAGIESVTFQIQDNNSGDTVYEQTVKRGYCPFGGNNNCKAFVFARNNNQWQNGREIVNSEYQTIITIKPKNSDSFKWFFNFKIQLPSS
jgi:hypothetical protein